MMGKWISREEEAGFPEFKSFQEVWNFFVSKYDTNMVLESVEFVDGVKCYFCGLVVDWESYREMKMALEVGEAVVGMKYVSCKQPIQIFEDGSVHIVH